MATGKGITVREAFHLVVEQAERVAGGGVHIENTPWPDDTDLIELRNFVADISSFQKATGWNPIIGLDQGIDRMIEYFSKNN